MVNRNYQAGRNFEYKRKREFEELGYVVIRAAGSHGPFDLIAIPQGIAQKHVLAIQCKRVATRSQWERLKKDFKAKPPLRHPTEVVQWLTGYITDERTTEDTWL